MSFPSLFDLLVALELDFLVALGLLLVDVLEHLLAVALALLLSNARILDPLPVVLSVLLAKIRSSPCSTRLASL